MSQHVDLIVDSVIGPIPGVVGSMVILATGEEPPRMFPVSCGVAEGGLCYAKLAGLEGKSPYDFFASLCEATGISMQHVELFRADDQVYCALFFRDGRGEDVRLTSEFAIMGINAAMAFGRPLLIKRRDMDAIADCSGALRGLRRVVGSLWPLPDLSDTASLRAMSDFIDSSMPNGSIFS